MANEIITTLHPQSDENTNLYPRIINGCIPNDSIGRNKLDDEINSLLNNVGDMSPKGVFLTKAALEAAYPSGANGIYVVTADGNWYFWKVSTAEWVSGGVYQSTQLADGSITYPKINNALINRYYDPNNLLFTANAIQRGKSYSTYYINNSAFTCFEINVTSGTTYYFTNVRYISKSGTIIVNGLDTTGIISYTADFTGTLYVTYRNQDSGWIMTTQSDLTGIQGYKFNGVNSELKNYLGNDNLLFNAKQFLRNKQYTTYMQDSTTTCVFSIDVVSGTTYYIYPGFRWLSKDGAILTGGNGTQYGSGPVAYTSNFTGKMYITFRNQDDGYVVTTNSDYMKVRGFYFSNNEKLDKIKIRTFGDSIMYGSSLNGVGPVDLLQRKYQQIRNTNNAVSSSTLQKNTGYPCIVETMINSNIITDNPDIVIFDGMRNDIGKSTLGTFDDSFDWETNGYTDSFVHAFEYFVGYIMENIPTCKIIYLIPNTSLSATLDDEKEYIDMIKLLCFKWSIPVVNVYEEGNLNPRIREQLLLYTDTTSAEDGTHPNEAGYNKAYVPLIYDMIQKIRNR